MKKFYFILMCLAIAGLMVFVSKEVGSEGDKNDELCIAVISVFLSVIGAAIRTDVIRGLFAAAGLFLTIIFMGVESLLFYLFGFGAVLLFMHRCPEVEEMVTNLWAPESNDDADNEKK